MSHWTVFQPAIISLLAIGEMVLNILCFRAERLGEYVLSHWTVLKPAIISLLAIGEMVLSISSYDGFVWCYKTCTFRIRFISFQMIFSR